MRSLFDYTNYRQYLRDYYEWAKTNVRGFSHRAFLAKAGMSGPNYLKRVMEGAHSLTEKSIPKFSRALGLEGVDAEYFRALVLFNEAQSLEDKDSWFEKLVALKSPHVQHMLELDQYEYYKDWYNVAIREILSYFEGDVAALAKEISPPVPRKKVERALALLERLRLIERGPGGGWVQTSKALATGPEVRSLLVSKFHQEMGRLAVESITRHHRDERYFSAVSMSLSRETYQELIGLIRDFRLKIVERVARDENPNRAYQVNIQMFPLSRPRRKRGRRKRSERL